MDKLEITVFHAECIYKENQKQSYQRQYKVSLSILISNYSDFITQFTK